MMKEITIIWLSKKESQIIIVTPNDIVSSSSVQSTSTDSPAQPVTPSEARKTRSKGHMKYFEIIIAHLQDPREIVLFGPDNTKEEFLDYLSENYSQLFSKVIGVEASQEMPEEKIIARGRKYI
jgi:stalled ribosome rescue protein Dom34